MCGENVLWHEWHTGTGLGFTVLELPWAVITHLLSALEALLFAAINYIHAWRIFKMPS